MSSIHTAVFELVVFHVRGQNFLELAKNHSVHFMISTLIFSITESCCLCGFFFNAFVFICVKVIRHTRLWWQLQFQANTELLITLFTTKNSILVSAVSSFHFLLVLPSAKCNSLLSPCLCQDIKNADLALFELNRVITLEPNWPEVYEQRAEVRPTLLRSFYYWSSSC